jgi:hypothetical protein
MLAPPVWAGWGFGDGDPDRCDNHVCNWTAPDSNDPIFGSYRYWYLGYQNASSLSPYARHVTPSVVQQLTNQPAAGCSDNWDESSCGLGADIGQVIMGQGGWHVPRIYCQAQVDDEDVQDNPCSSKP